MSSRKTVRVPVRSVERVFGGAGSAFMVELLRGILLGDPLTAQQRLERLLALLPEEVVRREPVQVAVRRRRREEGLGFPVVE